MGSLYVVSDVHGYHDDLVRGLDRAGFGGDDELWILGDLLDRGPDGIGVVNRVMSMQQEAPDRVHVLMGNHEILALGRYRFPRSQFALSAGELILDSFNRAKNYENIETWAWSS